VVVDSKHGFDDVATAVMLGPFRNPQMEKKSIFKSITGSVSNATEDAWKFIQGKKCTVFYSGSVAQAGGVSQILH